MNGLLCIIGLFIFLGRRISKDYERRLKQLLNAVLGDTDTILLQWTATSPKQTQFELTTIKDQWLRSYQKSFARMMADGCPMARDRLACLRQALLEELKIEKTRLTVINEFNGRVQVLLALSFFIHLFLAESWLASVEDLIFAFVAFVLIFLSYYLLQRHLQPSLFCHALAEQWIEACLAEERALIGFSEDYDNYLHQSFAAGTWLEDLRLQLLRRLLQRHHEQTEEKLQRLSPWLPMMDLILGLVTIPLLNTSVLLDLLVH